MSAWGRRYGAGVIERTKPEGKDLLTMADCLALFAGFFKREAAADLRVGCSAPAAGD